MKGIVYGGVAYFPVHPKADMHGLVRFTLQTKPGFRYIAAALESFKIPYRAYAAEAAIWQESKSATEQKVTEGHYGEVFVCSLAEAYLKPENYQRIPKGMKNE